MRSTAAVLTTLLSVCLLATVAAPLPATAQGTIADYRRAMTLEDRFDGLVVDLVDAGEWIGDTHRYWFRTSVEGGHRFAILDADTAQTSPAFDHERLAAALGAAADEEITAITLPFRNIDFGDDESTVEFSAFDDRWECNLEEYACEEAEEEDDDFRGFRGRDDDDDEPRPSPDGQWEALIHNYNVAIRPVDAEENGDDGDDLIVLSRDGSEGNAYELGSIAWSPDSTKLAAYRVKPGYRREVHYVESSPEDQLQPKHSTRVYAKPGDVLDVERPVLFHVDDRSQIVVDDELFPNAYRMSRLEWREDSSALTFEYNQRGHQVYRVIEVDAETGTPRAVISEEPETFFTYSSKLYRHDVDGGAEVIWMSERDGWNHLYMIDGATGEVKHQITSGEWVVRDVLEVDDESRQIWFEASGMVEGSDPYFIHLYRVGYDGTGLTELTEADANHDIDFSEDMEYFIDTYSTVGQPPVVELRRADGELVTEVARADITALTAAGWEAPEVFTAKGRDGTTDIWGIAIKPTSFDPSRTYPVIEYIYAGPHSSHVPKSFNVWSQMRGVAELGFIVVQIDGMGTSNRSKAFHDVAWQDLGDAGFPDRILWHQAYAAENAWYDVDGGVGIYGTSAGGQNSLGALLFHPEFYTVAVSAVGCHDNRMDKIWWNEQWMGWPIGPHYEASSNVVNAHRLEGDVLLIVGELDSNVDPSSTMQVVDALIEADKPFDLLVIPGANHTSGGEYGNHKRYDFFVEKLMGVTPPAWSDLAAAMSEETTAQGEGAR